LRTQILYDIRSVLGGRGQSRCWRRERLGRRRWHTWRECGACVCAGRAHTVVHPRNKMAARANWTRPRCRVGVFGGRAAAAAREREATTHHITPRTHAHAPNLGRRRAAERGQRAKIDHIVLLCSLSVAVLYLTAAHPNIRYVCESTMRGTCTCNVTSPIYTHIMDACPPRHTLS